MSEGFNDKVSAVLIANGVLGESRLLALSTITALHEEEVGRLREEFVLKFEKVIASSIKSKTERANLRRTVEKLETVLTDIRGIHHNCGQCNCALTSGEEQCVSFQIADAALATKESGV